MPGGGGTEAGVVGTPRCGFYVFLEEEEEGDGVGQPVGEAGIVVLLPLDLRAHSVYDLVEEHLHAEGPW